eukprot:TRINITY_DN462_c0_g2_i2.p2 TRINITY_DN462_c0_g2~~TRINITY_DN462_c0_g2_i2.p2  ORF type:complete len:111 (+),score=13.31 TRINITY_DN462_c0_g2_i2:185-517(+)
MFQLITIKALKAEAPSQKQQKICQRNLLALIRIIFATSNSLSELQTQHILCQDSRKADTHASKRSKTESESRTVVRLIFHVSSSPSRKDVDVLFLWDNSRAAPEARAARL